MIPFERTRQQTIPNSAVKIVGVGGAGANMLDRIALDGMEGAELLAANTDVRTLASSVAPEKIQMGRNLTKGLGTGGDPDLGRKAANEAELEIRDAIRDRRIIFICVGLGGGTGSGAAPLVARIAREAGAFTVVFATTPFEFEGGRRRAQAEAALEELSVIANALITFDNTRMGELVLAKAGVHEAFAAADRIVSESIRAVTRIVMRPGLVNIGLDELMAALDTPRSRCLFGSGIAEGENRAQKALKNALMSPLLDRGSLLHDADTVLVHVCGGEDLTLYELELLMRGLSKHVPEEAQILFGTAVDPSMGQSLSVTVVSSLPEEALHAGRSAEDTEVPPIEVEDELPVVEMVESALLEDLPAESEEDAPPGEPGGLAEADPVEEAFEEEPGDLAEADPVEEAPEEETWEGFAEEEATEEQRFEDPELQEEPESQEEPEFVEEEEPLTELEELPEPEAPLGPKEVEAGFEEMPAPLPPVPRPVAMTRPEDLAIEGTGGESGDSGEAHPPLPPIQPGPLPDVTTRVKLPPRRPARPSVGEGFDPSQPIDNQDDESVPDERLEEGAEEIAGVSFEAVEPPESPSALTPESLEEIQAAARAGKPQGELELDGGPKGKFEGEEPNLLGGEDLDIPPFLRRGKK